VLAVRLPRRVAGDPYTLALRPPRACGGTGPGVACLVARVPGEGAAHALPFRNETAVQPGSATGGGVAVVYGNGTLTITDRR
jgi:hypothetical protein